MDATARRRSPARPQCCRQLARMHRPSRCAACASTISRVSTSTSR
ncbi:hypothetical protein GC176_26750 [bacterium]|nr:hypothetical protein [bacterium]